MIKNKFGYISLVGKPNVGKSTLFNKIFGNNYSAISHKRHTTRESLFGILTFQNCQFCFYDNPGYGYEKNYRSEDKSNKSLNQQVDYINGFEGLFTGAGDDVLIGDNNSNRLDAGTGNNHLLGGGGADIFVIHLDETSITSISDFYSSTGQDGHDILDAISSASSTIL